MTLNFSQLAILGLATLSGQVFATVSVFGKFELDKKFLFQPTPAKLNSINSTKINPNDSLAFSMGRFDLAADMPPHCEFHVRADVKDALNNAANNNAANKILLQRAYARWNLHSDAAVLLGKSSHVKIDIDNESFTPYTTPHGPLPLFKQQEEFGMSILASRDTLDYKLGLARNKVSTAPSHDKFGWSFGGRASYTKIYNDELTCAFGVGLFKKETDNSTVQSMDLNLDALDDNLDPGSNQVLDTSAYVKNIFKGQEGLTADVSGVMGRWAFYAAAYLSKHKHKKITDQTNLNLVAGITGAAQTVPGIETQTHNPFKKDGYADSLIFEAIYLAKGKGYSLSHGVIQGPEFSLHALELGLRLSRQTYNNAAAVLDAQLWPTNIGTHCKGTDNAFSQYATGSYTKVITDSRSIFANYHTSQHTVVKFEFFDSRTAFKQNINQAPTNAFYFDNIPHRYVNIRGQFNF